MLYPKIFEEAIEQLGRLPGVGERSATRYLFSMTNWKQVEIEQFARSIDRLKELKFCIECWNFAEEDLCAICQDPLRQDYREICVVENISDALSIERSNTFKGLYHILGGVLNPLLGIGPEKLNLSNLNERINRFHINSLILAINPSVEGDATCSYICDQVQEHVKVDRIGFGVPIGGSLEYMDPLTISKALENRQQL